MGPKSRDAGREETSLITTVPHHLVRHFDQLTLAHLAGLTWVSEVNGGDLIILGVGLRGMHLTLDLLPGLVTPKACLDLGGRLLHLGVVEVNVWGG